MKRADLPLAMVHYFVIYTSLMSGSLAVRPRLVQAADSSDQIVLQQLSGDDETVRRDAITQLKEQIQNSPERFAQDLTKWLVPLEKARLWNEILTATEKAIPANLADSSAVSAFQIARVKAMMQLSDPRALSEAKAAFNVATQKNVDIAASLLLQALASGKQNNLAEKFKLQLGPGNPSEGEQNALGAIASRDLTQEEKEKLAQLPNDDSFESFVSRGNLLLLVGRDDEARGQFVRAAGVPNVKEKTLFAALDGIVRSERARSGKILAGNDIIKAMKYGARTSPLLSAIADVGIPIDQLYAAGRNIPLAKLPVEVGGSEKNENPADFSGRLDQPIEIVNKADPSDPKLLIWLQAVKTVPNLNPSQKQELLGILAQTPITAISLMDLGRDYFKATDDGETATRIFTVAVEKLHIQGEAANSAEAKSEVARILERYRDSYTPPIWNCIYADDHNAARLQIKIGEDFDRWAPRDDPAMARRTSYVRLYWGNAYGVLGQYEEEITILRQAKPADLNEGLQRSLKYYEAVALYRLGKYEEAIPGLEGVISWQGYVDRRPAHVALIRTLIHVKQLGRAADELKKFRDIYGGNDRDILYLANELKRAASEGG